MQPQTFQVSLGHQCFDSFENIELFHMYIRKFIAQKMVKMFLTVGENGTKKLERSILMRLAAYINFNLFLNITSFL